MNKAISIKVQGKTSFETKLNNVNQTFDFLLFMYFFFLDFLHIRMKRSIKSNIEDNLYERMQKQTTQISNHITNKQTTKQSHKA